MWTWHLVRQIAATPGSSGQRPSTVGSASPGRPASRRWLVAALAAAVVLLLAVGLAVFVTRRTGHGESAGGRLRPLVRRQLGAGQHRVHATRSHHRRSSPGMPGVDRRRPPGDHPTGLREHPRTPIVEPTVRTRIRRPIHRRRVQPTDRGPANAPGRRDVAFRLLTVAHGDRNGARLRHQPQWLDASLPGGIACDKTAAPVSSCGPNGPVPCADLLAITVNGHAEAVPVTTGVLESAVSITGGFNQAGADPGRRHHRSIGTATSTLTTCFPAPVRCAPSGSSWRPASRQETQWVNTIADQTAVTITAIKR